MQYILIILTSPFLSPSHHLFLPMLPPGFFPTLISFCLALWSTTFDLCLLHGHIVITWSMKGLNMVAQSKVMTFSLLASISSLHGGVRYHGPFPYPWLTLDSPVLYRPSAGNGSCDNFSWPHGSIRPII